MGEYTYSGDPIKIFCKNTTGDEYFTFNPITFSSDEINTFNIFLDNDEKKILNETIKSVQAGCEMLPLSGLRSILENKIDKVCLMKGYDIDDLDKNGRKTNKPLMIKFKMIENLITNTNDKGFIRKIIKHANDSLHELKQNIDNQKNRNYIHIMLNMVKRYKEFQIIL
jgi:hypothetical protein